MNSRSNTHFDVIIIGAGLSGIGAACHLKRNCPNKTFAMLEGRSNIGGTWDLFKYPGIRSDSDMHTFAYSFKPWTYDKTISDGATIMKYLNETIDDYELRKHIKYNHWISEVFWSSDEDKWTVKGKNNESNEVIQLSCNFLISCTGYYDYDEGYTPDFKGLENYKGQFVHPQKWTNDIEYENKEVIIIGSGATAVTLLPTMAEKTKHITMLQRSPTYMMSLPEHDKFSKVVKRWLPSKIAHFLARWKHVLGQIYFYKISKKKPKEVRYFIKKEIRKVLGEDYDVETHFNPKYNPWDQRICAVVDNDLFDAINEGKCTIVTDYIDSFTEKGILLQSGKELEADLVVSATGLKIKFVGGINIKVDGKTIDPSDLVNYKGMMLQDVPNMAMIAGYTNASWTLKSDLVGEYICRLLHHMDKKGLTSCTPTLSDNNVITEPASDLASGYIQRALDELPKQGDKYPWKLNQNYIKDMIALRFKSIDDGYLVFKSRKK
jgi:monooxygenase